MVAICKRVTDALQLWPLRGTFLVVLPTFLLLSAFTAASSRAEAQLRTRQASPQLDGQLTDVGEKLYELNSRVPSLFMKAFKEEGAGEGLSSSLFNDAITVLQLALEKNDRNTRARFVLAKCYFAKSGRGEGRWDRRLLISAEEEFKRVLTDSRTARVTEKQTAKVRQMLEEIRKIREGQGELVD